MIENVYQEPRCEPTQESSSFNKTLVDKAIDNVPKLKSVRTQYNINHFSHEEVNREESNKLIVKLPTPKKQKNISVNTTLSFHPFADVEINYVKDEPSLCESTDENEDETMDDESDEDFCPATESSASSDENDEKINNIPSVIDDRTQFLVYWSCLLPLLKHCLKCNALALVKKQL